MVQERSIPGQVSRIISEKGTELLRISRIPENLWPEAIQHAVWLKNRTPARALRKKDAKTPYEALKGDKPTLTRERIWGSRAYVTCPAEFRTTAEMTKLHSPRGWLGYFVGCESEAMYHIYSPQKHKVYRIGAARVDDGEGLDDPHDAPCLEDRVPTRDVEISDPLVPEVNNDVTDDQSSNDAEAPALPAETESSINLDSPAAEDTTYQRQTDEGGTDTDHESDGDTTGPEVVSRYFDQSRHAGVAKRVLSTESMVVVPGGSRQATHGQSSVGRDVSTEASDVDDDSWYYSDDGQSVPSLLDVCR